MARSSRIAWLTFISVAVAGRGALAATDTSQFVKQKVAVLERDFRDDDWAGILDVGHDLLMRIPGQPDALKWVGLALAEVGARRLALRALTQSERARPDPQVKEAIARVRAGLVEVRVEISGATGETLPALTERVLALVERLDRAAPRIAHLPDEARQRLPERLRELGTLGGLAEAPRPTVETVPPVLRVTLHDVEPQRASWKLDLADVGYEDAAVTLDLAPGTTTIPIALRALATLSISGPSASEPLFLDDKPVKGGALRVTAGAHKLGRARGGLRWVEELEVAPGESKELVLEQWPRVRLVGIQPDDRALVGRHALPVSDGAVELPPGRHELIVERAEDEVRLSVVARVGETTEAPLPATLLLRTDAPDAISVEAEGQTGARRLAQEAPLRWVLPAGDLRLTLRRAHHHPLVEDVQLPPGGRVRRAIPASRFAPTPEWQKFQAADRSWRQQKRRTAVAIAVAGLALAAGAGVCGALSALDHAHADAAYRDYQAASGRDPVAELHQTVIELDRRAEVFAGVAIGAGLAAAVLFTAAIVQAARRSPVALPAAGDSGPAVSVAPSGPAVSVAPSGPAVSVAPSGPAVSVAPWLDGTGGGLVLTVGGWR